MASMKVKGVIFLRRVSVASLPSFTSSPAAWFYSWITQRRGLMLAFLRMPPSAKTNLSQMAAKSPPTAMGTMAASTSVVRQPSQPAFLSFFLSCLSLSPPASVVMRYST